MEEVKDYQTEKEFLLFCREQPDAHPENLRRLHELASICQFCLRKKSLKNTKGKMLCTKCAKKYKPINEVKPKSTHVNLLRQKEGN